jgi:hypothetical protein
MSYGLPIFPVCLVQNRPHIAVVADANNPETWCLHELEVLEEAVVHGQPIKLVRVLPEPVLFAEIHPKRLKWDSCRMLDTEAFQMVVSVNQVSLDKQQALDDVHGDFARLARSNRIRQMYDQQSIAVAVNDPLLSAWNITARHIQWSIFKRLFSNKGKMTSILRGCSFNKPGFKQLILNLHAVLPSIVFEHTSQKRGCRKSEGGPVAEAEAGAGADVEAESAIAVLSPLESVKPKRMRIAQSRLQWLAALASSMEDDMGKLELEESRAAEQLVLVKAEIGKGKSGLGVALAEHEKLLEKKRAQLKEMNFKRRQLEPERMDLEEEVSRWTELMQAREELAKVQEQCKKLHEECLHANRKVQMKKLEAGDMQTVIAARTTELEACKAFIVTLVRTKKLSRGTKVYAQALLGLDAEHSDHDTTAAFRAMSRLFHPQRIDAMHGLDKIIKASMKNLYKQITDAKTTLVSE